MITIEGISKNFGQQMALAPLSLEFTEGGITVLIGASGCGKTTLLRIIMGLIPPDTGKVFVGNSLLTAENAHQLRRRMGYVIQEGGLFPHLTARGNLELQARYLRHPRAGIEKRITELADMVRLSEGILIRFPKDLSGGQRQRVGLMRALMLDPDYILMDEPLGSLDPITRRELQDELKQIFGRLGKTVVLVTHDMGEAAFLGDEIALMRKGRIVQRGKLDDLLHRPSEEYVSEFIRSQRSPLPALAPELPR